MKQASSGTAASPLSLPISVRAYAAEVDLEAIAEPASEDGDSPLPKPRPPKLNEPSAWTFVFDTETTIDPSQRFRVGFYRLYEGERLDEEFLFHDPAALTRREARTSEAYCRRQGMPPPITLEDFRSALLKATAIGAMIVTFNGPFDIARIAIDASPARATKWRRKMQDGFSFRLSEDDFHPCIQIKTLNPSASIVELTAPRRQDTGRSQRKKEDATPANRGFFTDVKTLAKAVTSRAHSLESLCAALETPTQKVGSQEHGAPLSSGYLDYARSDVAATWECYIRIKAKYDAYGLNTPAHDIISEASIGKAAIASMGVRPWREVQPGGLDPGLVSLIMSTYFGGRTEVRRRREVVRVLHTDFTSMYPTVCTAQGLWRFVIGEGFTHRDGTDEVRAFLEAATPEQFQDLAAWPKLTALVRVTPDFDLFPIRAPFGASTERKGRGKAARPSATIGLNYLRADRPLWFTLADCLVAKFLSGVTPEIEEALVFEPGPPQAGLEPVKVLGRHSIDPYKHDFYRELICARQREERSKAGKSETEQAAIEEVRGGLKTVANASSYGMFVQVNVNREPKKAMVRVFKPDGSTFTKRMAKLETLGPWFNPIIATLITGAARLMVALAEHQVLKAGLDWAFCDTDSMAIAKPEAMGDADFEARAYGVVEWFRPLNPYGLDEPILKIEKVNYAVGSKTQIEPLFCWAISSKRYALFNIDADGRPIIRKASAHGLGHLRSPYEPKDAPTCFPQPLPEVLSGKEKLQRWHYDVWCAILEAVLRGEPDAVYFDYHPALEQPTVSRYTASSPELLKWFEPWNDGKAYADQIKPHGFLYTLHRRRLPREDAVPDPLEGLAEDGRILPVAPFEKDLSKAIAQAFDRVTGLAVRACDLETYAEALIDYPYRPEAKFGNGEAFDTGRTERLYVHGRELRFIGKEADRWEEEYFLGLRRGELAIEYGGDPVKGGLAFEANCAAPWRRLGRARCRERAGSREGPWQRSKLVSPR